MAVELGLALSAGPKKGEVEQWLDELDAALPVLQPHFKSLWMTDHVFWEDRPTYEAWTVTAFLMARYPNMVVGPMVLGQSYRNPALLAKMGATLQALSRGRFVMAIGAGWKEDEYRAYGYEYPSAGVRIEQLEEALEILCAMWTEPGKVTFRGKHYQVVDAWCKPKPNPLPPLVVGGGGTKTMRLAARFADWWNISDSNFAKYSERMAVLDRHCAELGRDPGSLRRTWFGRLVLGRGAEEVKARGGRWTVENAFAGTPAEAVEQMQQFIDIGVDYFMIDVLELSNPDVMGMLLDEVAPALARA